MSVNWPGEPFPCEQGPNYLRAVPRPPSPVQQIAGAPALFSLKAVPDESWVVLNEGEPDEFTLYRRAEEAGGAWLLMRDQVSEPIEVALTGCCASDGTVVDTDQVRQRAYLGVTELVTFRDDERVPAWMAPAGIIVRPPEKDVDLESHLQERRVVDVDGLLHWRDRASLQDQVIGPIGSAAVIVESNYRSRPE